MKDKFKIGTAISSDIRLKDAQADEHQATIYYQKGNWILENHNEDLPIWHNGKKLLAPQVLDKYDKIKIANQTIYWADYFYEGDKQDLRLKDFLSWHGRISRANFRVLSLLGIGLMICIYFLPGLTAHLAEYALEGRRGRADIIEPTQFMLDTRPFIHLLGYGLLALLFIQLSIKRMRDAGQPIWKLFVPIINLKILYGDRSK